MVQNIAAEDASHARAFAERDARQGASQSSTAHSATPSPEVHISGFRLEYLYGWVREPEDVDKPSLLALYIDGSFHNYLQLSVLPPSLFGAADATRSFFCPIAPEFLDSAEHHYRVVHLGPDRVLADAWLSTSPAPLFDRRFYFERYPDLKQYVADAMEHYLEYGYRDILPGNGKGEIRRAPHPLFDAEYYVSQINHWDKEENPLLHFLDQGWKEGLSPHPLFSPKHYCAQFKDAEIPLGNPLEHYLQFGWRAGYDPHPLFSVRFYRRLNAHLGAAETEPLSHYLRTGSRQGAHPHPCFDTILYSGQLDTQTTETPLEHFLRIGRYDRRLRISHLHSNKYVQQHYGRTEDIWYDCGAFSTSACRHTPFSGEHRELMNELASRTTEGNVRIIAVVHDASTTGAPLILLHLLRRLKRDYPIDICVILLRGGELEQEFRELGITLVADTLFKECGASNCAPFINLFNLEGRTLAISNSLESYPFLCYFPALDIPLISLVHEYAAQYPLGHSEGVMQYSDAVIFPAEHVRSSALSVLSSSDELAAKAHVIPQGLYKQDVLHHQADTSSAIRRELGIGLDTFLVVGCGMIDPRKGSDLFIASAQMFRRISGCENFVFVWIGDTYLGERSNSTAWFWTERDIKHANLEGQVRFIGPRPNTSDYFQAANAMVLPSRLDPFPSVVLEAMAAELPVIVFEGVTGSVEALDGVGYSVPFLDLAALAERLTWIWRNPEAAASVAARARKKVIDQYDFDRYVRRVLEVAVQRTPNGAALAKVLEPRVRQEEAYPEALIASG